MSEAVGDFLSVRLREWGVGQVFGYPGDGINGIVVAFGRSGNRPRFVQANNDLNQVTRELGAMGGAPKFEESQSLPELSYAEFARTLGFQALTIDHPDRLAPAWDHALTADRPTPLDVHCDPEIPPIPPHATIDQIKSMTQAILKGDPHAWHLLLQGAKTKAEELLPSRS